MTKVTVATTWLDGCSGCHMSLLDIDERLIALADKIELVYSPLVDNKIFPDSVDVAIVEGAVSSEEDEHKIKMIRERSRILVALGDCAVSANIPSLRNTMSVVELLDEAYIRRANVNPLHPAEVVPALRPKAVPVHEVVNVDVFVQGCPPSADTIYFTIAELLEGRIPDLTDRTRPGA
ncbi:MAG: NADP oxidoreductase [Anaerolineales bacterium]|nr:NADP oxidoreductase [Anaerolineales bacterium]